MPNIRRPPGRFGPVAPGVGAAAGAGLQAAGQALEAFADLGTNRELLNIRDQEQFDRLEFAQFEKVERSEAIAQFTQKQIWRNQESERILSEARQSRNFSGVQEAMDSLEDDFNAELFQGRSQVFRDVFESMDRSARVGNINTLGTAVQKGNMGLIQENYQLAARGFVEAVGPLSDPAEIAERFTDLSDSMVRMGFTQAAIEAISGDGLREAMEKYVRSLPLVEGLAALSNEAVAEVLGEDGRERMRRDLNVTINTLRRAQEVTSEAHAGVVGLNVLAALAAGESATALISRIRGDDRITGVREQDMVNLVGVIERGRDKGPKSISTEELKANHTFSKEAMKVLLDGHKGNVKGATDDSDGLTEEQRTTIQFELHRQGMAILAEATRLAVRGQFNKSELIGLAFDMLPLSEGLMNVDQDREGFLEKMTRGFISGLGPGGGIASALLEKKVPNAAVQEVRSDMFLGQGRYGGLSRAQRAVMGRILVSTAINTEKSGESLIIGEASAIANAIFAEAEKRFNSEEFGLTGEAAKQVSELVFNSSTLATKPRQQPDVSGVADSIRKMFSNGLTAEEIEAFARTRPRFSQEAFDRALAAAGGSTALSGELGTLRGQSGTVSTEISVTVTDPRINNGKPTNIPTLVEGQVDVQGLVDSGNPTGEQVEIAIGRAIERQEAGATLPFFKDIEQAEEAAVRRHEAEARRTGR